MQKLKRQRLRYAVSVSIFKMPSDDKSILNGLMKILLHVLLLRLSPAGWRCVHEQVKQM